MRVVVATLALNAISGDSRDHARRVSPVLRFIDAACWAGPFSDGRLHLAAAYAGQPAHRAIAHPLRASGIKYPGLQVAL